MGHFADEVRDALVVHGRKRDNRHAKAFGKDIQIQVQAALFRDVDHVCRNHHRQVHIGKLRSEEQVTFNVRSINNIDDKVRFASKQVVYCGAFVFGIGKESIGTRQVHHADVLITEFKEAFLLFDSHARPVTNMLASTRKGIKKSRFTAVRVTGNCNSKKLRSH